MVAQISANGGFIAALDESGGSTPCALRHYGIPDNAYSGDAEMFRFMHEMRVRIMSAPAFTGAKVIAAILFEGTLDGQVGQAYSGLFVGGTGRHPLCKGRQGTRRRETRCPVNEADAEAGGSSHPGGEARCLRHQGSISPELRSPSIFNSPRKIN
jgi:hypothetical protein